MKRSGELLEVNNCSLLLSIQAACSSSSSKQQLLKKTVIQAIRAKSPQTRRTLTVRDFLRGSSLGNLNAVNDFHIVSE